MNCKQVRELWDRYRDGDLAGADALGLESHLADCSHCEQLWRMESKWLAVLGDTAPVSTEDEAHAFTAQVIRQWSRPKHKSNVIAQIGRWTAAAAAIALVVTLVAPQFWGVNSDGNTAVMTAVNDHRSSDRMILSQVKAPVGAAREALRGASMLLDVDRYTDGLANFLEVTTATPHTE